MEIKHRDPESKETANKDENTLTKMIRGECPHLFCGMPAKRFLGGRLYATKKKTVEKLEHA